MDAIEYSEKNGIACYYKKTEKPCIFWLHGYTMNAHIWEEIWQLMPGWSHLAIDIPSHGRSASIKNFSSLPSLAREIAGIAASFNASHIVGLSFGGILGIQIAIEAPDKFKALFLCSSPVAGGPIDPDAQSKNTELIKLYAANKKQLLTEKWMQSPPHIFTGAKEHPALWKTLTGLIDEHKWEELEGNTFSIFTGHTQTAKDLGTISMPVYLFVGDEDMENIKRCSEFIKRSVNNCKRIYIPDTGHLSILEAPEIVIPLLIEILETV